MKLDILAFGAHPDDVELSCSGTLLKHIEAGKKVGIVDLTEGELGTRGTAETREEESKAASAAMGIHARSNLKMKDGFFMHDEAAIRRIIVEIRKYRPEIVLTPAPYDRHPDHGRASKLITDSCFYSGLVKIKTEGDQEAWRPKAVYHYIQDNYLKPDFVVDITKYMEKRMSVISAYKTQFYNPASSEPETPISTPAFLSFLRARAESFGRLIHVTYAEGFITSRTPGVNSLFDLL